MMEVSQLENALKGEVYAFHYLVRGWGKEGQILTLIHKIDIDKRWKVISYTWNEPKLIIKIEIVINPLPVVIIVAAIGAIGTGLFCYLSLDKIEKIIESPMIKTSILGTVLIGGLILFRSFTNP